MIPTPLLPFYVVPKKKPVTAAAPVTSFPSNCRPSDIGLIYTKPEIFMAERKNPQLDAEHQAVLRRMMLLAENKNCADCKGPSPRWASTNLGIFICITCSGIHRKLGTHISQVRSITLDTWTPSQIQHFKKFGNAKAAHYFEACLPPDFRRPHSSDSMQMERFIRDKYEHKRYITVENGGLGGHEASRHRSSRLAPRPTPAPLGPRPAQSMLASRQPAYDSAPTVRKTGMSSMSYGGRFSRPVKPMREPQSTVATGQSFTSSTGSSNAFQRASTLKQLLTMGFPQDVAVKAVEVGDGDLQRSLDWVLQQSGKSTNQTSSAVPLQPVQKDLLDFDEPPAAMTTPTSAPQRPAPKIMATESLISSTAKDPSIEPRARTVTNSGFADFANFGDFQRTLPSAVPSKEESTASNVPTATTPKNAPLTSSLANLYKKSSPKPTTTPSYVSQFSNAISPHHFRISSEQTVGKTNVGDDRKKEDNLGLTTFESLSPQNLRLTGKTIPSMRLSEQNQPAGAKTPQKLSSTNEPPPPPPPPQHLLFPSTQEHRPPPPPSPKLGGNANQALSTPNLGETRDEETTHPGSNAEAKEEEAPKNVSTAKEDEQETDGEEEDPFAALSMMALSSATSAQKKRKDKGVSSLPKALEPSSSKGAEVVQSSINLDELLS